MKPLVEKLSTILSHSPFDPSSTTIISISFNSLWNTEFRQSTKYFSVLKTGIITDILILLIIMNLILLY